MSAAAVGLLHWSWTFPARGLSTRQGYKPAEFESESQPQAFVVVLLLLLQVESGLLPVGALAALSQVLCNCRDAKPAALSRSKPCQAQLRGLCQEPSLPQPRSGDSEKQKLAPPREGGEGIAHSRRLEKPGPFSPCLCIPG